MSIILQVAFTAILAFAIWFFARNISRINNVIRKGRAEKIAVDPASGWRNVLLLAFGQKKMFKNPLVALLHFVVYAGFIIVNIEVMEILIDGIFGTHRVLGGVLGGFYPWLINAFEVLALLVIVVCAIFLIRRNVLRVRRLAHPDLAGWPKSDANYILIMEILLMSAFLKMNATDSLLQLRGVGEYASHGHGPYAISQYFIPFFERFSSDTLVILERIYWWFHILGILFFLNYLPYSKHLHILYAFPNAYFTRPQKIGKMDNMPVIQKEVALAMGADISQDPVLTALPDAPPEQFGANDIFDLSWKNLLDAYTCTECGRCSAACPASITGKALSPRLIMMKTRDRCEAVKVLPAMPEGESETEDKKLLHGYITVEELRACTTCAACVEECPVSISPLDIINQLRRYLILDESNSPNEWNAMFGNIENNFAPWKFNPDDRTNWIPAS